MTRCNAYTDYHKNNHANSIIMVNMLFIWSFILMSKYCVDRESYHCYYHSHTNINLDNQITEQCYKLNCTKLSIDLKI